MLLYIVTYLLTPHPSIKTDLEIQTHPGEGHARRARENFFPRVISRATRRDYFLWLHNYFCTLQHTVLKSNHRLLMPPLASIFTGNSKTKAGVTSELKVAPALRHTKPINAVPSALLLPREARSALEKTLEIVPAEQRRFDNLIEDQSTLLRYYGSNKAIHGGAIRLRS
jgi:hypothetical protein